MALQEEINSKESVSLQMALQNDYSIDWSYPITLYIPVIKEWIPLVWPRPGFIIYVFFSCVDYLLYLICFGILEAVK